MHYLSLILRPAEPHRLLFWIAILCAGALLFMESTPFAMAVVACVFGFCARRPRKRPAFADQSLEWW